MLGRDIDDAAPRLGTDLLIYHLLHRPLATQEHTFSVYRQNLVPLRFRGFQQGLPGGYGRIVDHHVQTAVTRHDAGYHPV